MKNLELILETAPCFADQQIKIQILVPTLTKLNLARCQHVVSINSNFISRNNIFLAGWTDWSNWTKCTVECGATGLKSRTRSCSEAEIGSKWCRCGASSPVISCVGCLTSDWSIMNKSETNISDIFIPGYHDESDLGYLQVEKCDACRKYRVFKMPYQIGI